MHNGYWQQDMFGSLVNDVCAWFCYYLAGFEKDLGLHSSACQETLLDSV
jgi:hypothetical protein